MGRITLVLAKDGEQQFYEFNTDLKSLISASKKLQEFMKENWQLLDCSGDPPTIVAYIKRQIEAYNKNPEAYKVPIKETLKVTEVQAKDISKAGKKLIKEKMLHPFRKSDK